MSSRLARSRSKTETEGLPADAPVSGVATPLTHARDGEPVDQVVIEGIVKDYGETRALKGVTLAVRRGEIFGLLGSSGCGKTTLLRCIAGLEEITEGKVMVAGDCVADASTRKSVPPEKRNMGMVFQSYAIWPHMTVAENVAFPLKLRRVKKVERAERTRAILKTTGLDTMADRPANNLSGGQQQRVALARALVYMPDVLLLDEPLSNLDTNLREEMRREILRLQRSLGVTVIFVTHDRSEAMALATRVAIINEGQVEQLGTPDEVYERPQTPFVRDFLGNSVSIRGRIETTGGLAEFTPDNGVATGSLVVPQGEVQLPLAPNGVGATVGTRPEDIRILDSLPESGCAVAGLIVDVLYQGTHVEYTVAIGGDEVRIADTRSTPRKVEDPIWLAFDAAQCWFWVDE
jgi:ABC-type Fe3+/spermidine/putrescine transport system ATPase subunit